MTAYELAQQAGVAYKTVYNLMAERTVPQPSVVGRVAEALDSTAEWIMNGQGRQTVQQRSVASEQTVDTAVSFLARQFGVTHDELLKVVTDGVSALRSKGPLVYDVKRKS